MNALITLLLLFLGFAHPAPNHLNHATGVNISTPGSNGNEIMGVQTTRNNPRTVVALEDTHFKPAN
jgi:hypothetical protein